MSESLSDPLALPAFIISIVGLAVATLGALTGLISLAWQMSTRRRGADRVTVSIANSVLLGADDLGSGVLVCVEAVNSGGTAVGLNSWGFQISNGRGGFVIANPMYPSTTLPHMLAPGSNAQFFVPAEDLGDQIRRNPGLSPRDLRAFVLLATGKKVFARRKGVPLAPEFWKP